MTSIGFRAEKDAINWAVVSKSGDALRLDAHGCINASVGDRDAECLAHFRKEVLLLVEQYKPTVAYVRTPETYNRRAQSVVRANSSDSRLRVEGVILEACYSTGAKTLSGLLNAISHRIGSDSAKDYLSADSLREIKWPKKDTLCREAILAAVAGVEENQ